MLKKKSLLALALLLGFSCQKPRLEVDLQLTETVAYTESINYARQNYLGVTVRTPLKAVDERGLSGLPTMNLLTVGRHMFFTTFNGYLYLLRLDDIYEGAHTRISDGGRACPTLYGIRIFIPSEDERFGLYVYNLPQGKTEWQLEGQPSFASPVVIDTAVFHTSWRGNIFSLKIQSGVINWDTNIGENIRFSLAYGQDRLFAGGDQGTIRCLNPQDGSLLWNRSLNEALSGSPVLCRDRLLIVTYPGNLFILDSQNGEVLHKLSFGINLYTQVSTDGRIIVIPLSDGRIQAYRFSNFDPLWSRELTGPASAPLLITDNCVLVGTTRNLFAILDRYSGEVLQEIQLEGRPRTTPLVFDDKIYLAYEYKELVIYAPQEE